MTAQNSRVRALKAELDGELFIAVELFGSTFRLKKVFKRLMFLRLLTSDPYAALALVFADGEIERLEGIDMDENGLEQIINSVSEALVGGPKN